MSARRGSILLVALAVTIVLSLVGLLLLLTTASLQQGGGQAQRHRLFFAAEGRLRLAAAAATGGPGSSALRRLALPLRSARGDAGTWSAPSDWGGVRVSLSAPVFAGLSRDTGSDLRIWNQRAFVTELYRVTASAVGTVSATRPERVTAELATAPVSCDIARLPEPEPR